MSHESSASPEAPARMVSLRVRNYRALRSIHLDALSPLTALLGPNASGKSTVFDVFAFLSECFSVGLRKAWDRRGRFKELRSRGADGPIEIEVKYRERRDAPLITYHLGIDETPSGPVVAEEWLQWKRGRHGKPFQFLKFSHGAGAVISGAAPDESDERVPENLDSPEILAVSTLGQLAKHPRVAALRKFITGWYLSYLTADHTRGVAEAGPQERLSQTGDNLPNVIQYLRERHAEALSRVLASLSLRVPRLERVDAELLADGRLLLQVKDAPFERPILAKWASDGTLKMLAYLLVLNDPAPAPFIGIEEPENHLHPRLLAELSDECREASARSQLIVTSHSPFFVNGLRAEEVWVLHRGEDGYTRAERVSGMHGIAEFMEEGALLGHLWMSGHFAVGDPLSSSTSGSRHLNG